MRPLHRLSARRVETAKPSGKATLLADGGGLYLRVSPTGSKSWIFRYRAGSRQHDLGCGPWPDVTLAEAREKAHAIRRSRLDGLDPIKERVQRRHAEAVQRVKAATLAEVAEQYLQAHAAGWRGGASEAQWRASLATHAGAIMGLPVDSIGTHHVLQVIEPIWQTRTETASRVRARIENLLAFAVTKGLRPAGDNPARWRGHLEHSLPARAKVRRVQHHAALPYGEIGQFMVELRGLDAMAARALEFAILTAARSGEVLGARWEEIDRDAKVWTIPAERMKGHREHRVPLSDAAMEVVESMVAIKHSPFVFPGRYGRLHHSGFPDMLQRLGRGDLTAHGFRSSFSQWAAERTAYPYEVREMALAHSVGSQVERSYQRSDLFDRRRRLMDDWANFCVSPVTSGEVVPLRA